MHFADPDGNTWSVQEIPDYSQLGEWQADAGVTDNRAIWAQTADPNFGVVPDR